MGEGADTFRLPGPSEGQPPIMILGIMPRCGSTFLKRLLGAHPHCATPEGLGEDHFLRNAQHLDAYVADVCGTWRAYLKNCPINDEAEDALLASLGKTLLDFLGLQCPPGSRLVTKTPQVENLHLLFRVFPEVKPIFLIRDGRAVIESTIRSGFWQEAADPYAWYTETWTRAARQIVNFDHLHGADGERYLMVRYEDLVTDVQGTLERIFAFTGLDADVFDFRAAADLPVTGSSTFDSGYGKRPHWQPKEKTTDFRPLERWQEWTPEQHRRFNAVAGPYMEKFGYRLETAPEEP